MFFLGCHNDRDPNNGQLFWSLNSGSGFSSQSHTLPYAVYAHQTTRMANGDLFVSGGFDINNAPTWDAYAMSASWPHSFYDVDLSSLRNDLAVARAFHAQARVTSPTFANNRIVMTGGETNGGITSSIEIYDPLNDVIYSHGNMIFARKNHTLTEIKNSNTIYDGLFLIVGGEGAFGFLPIAELYDPVTGSSALLNSPLWMGRSKHTATSLFDGRVLIVGGLTNGGSTNTAEIFDPFTSTFQPVFNTMSENRAFHAAAYLDNKTPSMASDDAVLIVGGLDSLGFALDNADLFDPFTDTFVPVNSVVHEPVFFHTVTPLNSSSAYDAAVAAGFTNLNFQNPMDSNPTEQIEIFQYTYSPTFGPDGFFVRTRDALYRRAVHTTNHIHPFTLMMMGGIDEFAAATNTAEELDY